MSDGVRTPHPTIILYGSGVSLVSDLSGEIRAEEAHGLFAGDTRVLSTYRIEINGNRWRNLGHSRLGHGTAQWEFENPPMRDPFGGIDEGTALFTLRRRVDGALHDDITLRSFASRKIHLRLTLQIDADFADIFEVKSESLPPRLNSLRSAQGNIVTFTYERKGFRRGLHLWISPECAAPSFVGSRAVIEVTLEPHNRWTCCLEAVPEIDRQRLAFRGDPHADEPEPRLDDNSLSLRSDPILARPFARGQSDLHALAIPQPDHPPLVAAGAPWFFTLFGRDSLVAALMAGIDGSWIAQGCLEALAKWQGRQHDAFRDEEPGKIAHELRHDELTVDGTLPYSPYYGTHDAPALYCLTLWQAWRWTGERELLETYLRPARDALAWCEEYGDRDADGLQEYMSASRKGYRNQGWKDADDAIVDGNGKQAELPIATIELQGYLFAARLAMAELFSEMGSRRDAERLRSAAETARGLVEERYWMPREGYYALALDGQKQQMDSIASNPGHLLWCGLPHRERAFLLGKRLLKEDMFSGWGLRTLSADNPAYNPLSYQLGSVWPHDTAIAAAGLWRYGLREEASTLLHGILQAALAFEEDRLPELFCGLDLSCGFPVPYAKANSPQAWAAAVPLLASHLFLGLVPDAPNGRCHIAPWLPSWISQLHLTGVRIGSGRLDVVLSREADTTKIVDLRSDGISVTIGNASAPLWGYIS